MGYYTDFRLTTTPHTLAAIHEFRRHYKEAGDCLDSEGFSKSTSKWYSAQGDLMEFSTRFPNVLFTLTSEGENFGHYTRLYVRNGASQFERGTVVYPEFDESKLKND